VPGGVVLAIWGRESGFGAAKIPYDAFEVLGTKAFLATRKEMFRTELIAALQILQKGYARRGAMKTSWAGAMGQPQFLPTSYLKHAVDFDGDGIRDIWSSTPDTLASIANYLKTITAGRRVATGALRSPCLKVCHAHWKARIRAKKFRNGRVWALSASTASRSRKANRASRASC
jgi:membrane-bound lytic murein transglycosylase B